MVEAKFYKSILFVLITKWKRFVLTLGVKLAKSSSNSVQYAVACIMKHRILSFFEAFSYTEYRRFNYKM